MAKKRKRRFINRRRPKWAGTVFFCTLLLLFALSSFMAVDISIPNQQGKNEFTVLVIGGGVRLIWSEDVPAIITADAPDIKIRQLANPGVAFWWRWTPNPMGWRLHLPGWLPLLLIAAPTAYLWRTDRRAKPWQCDNCRYDLRGLKGSRCPECGAERPDNTEQHAEQRHAR